MADNVFAGQGKVAFGVFVDGVDVKFAHLSAKGKQVVLRDLKPVTLVRRLEEQVAAAPAEGFGESTDVFAEAAPVPAEGTSEERGADTNHTIILSLLSQYPPQKYFFTYCVSEPSIYYLTLESDFGLKKEKLKARIIEELKNTRSTEPPPDAVHYLTTEEKNILCVVREDGLQLVNILEEIKPNIGNRLPKIPFLESADIALMNLVRLSYELPEEEITLIAYVGVEFSRIIFMKGNHFFHLAPLIGEGHESANIQNTLYSRILLEQDNLALPKVNRILLAGHAHKIDFKNFLASQFHEVEVDYIKAPQIDATLLGPEAEQKVAEYAIPIATAWRALDPKNPKFYSMDLLPVAVREGQKAFKLAWHGYLLMLLIFVSAFFFTLQIEKIRNEIKERKTVLEQKQKQRAENEQIKADIRGLEQKMAEYQNALALFDSLVPGSDKWGKAVSHLTNGAEDLNSLWLNSAASTADGGMSIAGISIYRSRIPRLASLFESATLRSVTVKPVREKEKKLAYEFQIEVPRSGTK